MRAAWVAALAAPPGGARSRLAALDGLAYQVNAFVFPLWTFAVIAGAIWAEDAWGRYWGWDPKETWAFITWLVYAAYLHARATAGWRGRKAAALGLVGFACFLINYFGVNFFARRPALVLRALTRQRRARSGRIARRPLHRGSVCVGRLGVDLPGVGRALGPLAPGSPGGDGGLQAAGRRLPLTLQDEEAQCRRDQHGREQPGPGAHPDQVEHAAHHQHQQHAKQGVPQARMWGDRLRFGRLVAVLIHAHQGTSRGMDPLATGLWWLVRGTGVSLIAGGAAPRSGGEAGPWPGSCCSWPFWDCMCMS